MNKDRQSREKCKYCPNIMRRDGYYICRFRPEMRLDRYTRRPDWCRKKMVVIGPVKDLKLNDKKIADEGFVTALSVIDEWIREDAEVGRAGYLKGKENDHIRNRFE